MPQAAHALDSLPFDILCRILVFCHPKDLANILATGKALRAMDNPTTWSVLVRDRFALDGTHSKLEYIKLHKNSGNQL